MEKAKDNKLTTNYYQKYVGCYAKRFYSPFDYASMAYILDFKIKDGYAHFVVGNARAKYEWDVEDCVIITDSIDSDSDERVVNVNDKQYKGVNPFLNAHYL